MGIPADVRLQEVQGPSWSLCSCMSMGRERVGRRFISSGNQPGWDFGGMAEGRSHMSFKILLTFKLT